MTLATLLYIATLVSAVPTWKVPQPHQKTPRPNAEYIIRLAFDPPRIDDEQRRLTPGEMHEAKKQAMRELVGDNTVPDLLNYSELEVAPDM